MNSSKDVQYRLDLAQGFLKEAEQDFELGRWRSCVDNSQLSVENAGKAILMLFGVSPKTHDPAKHLTHLVRKPDIPEAIRDRIKEVIPEFLTLGLEEHFMTDYGDESSYTLPWEMFTEEAASTALQAARLCSSSSESIVEEVRRWRASQR